MLIPIWNHLGFLNSYFGVETNFLLVIMKLNKTKLKWDELL